MKQKRKFTGKEKALLTALALAMAAVIGVGAFIVINNVNTANEQAANTEHTTVEYTHPVTTEDNTTADNTENSDSKKTKSKTSSKSTASKASGTASKSTTLGSSKSTVSKSTASKSSSKSKSASSKSKSLTPGGSKIPVYTPTDNKSHSSKEVCIVNGKKCCVGDTITMTLNLKTPKVLVNYQGYTSFDTSKLKFISADSEADALTNCKDGIIYYNASVLRGIDFTSTGTVYYAKFKVREAGTTSISNNFQVLTDMDDNPVKESKCEIGIEIFD